jgi:hypothetical protein
VLQTILIAALKVFPELNECLRVNEMLQESDSTYNVIALKQKHTQWISIAKHEPKIAIERVISNQYALKQYTN